MQAIKRSTTGSQRQAAPGRIAGPECKPTDRAAMLEAASLEELVRGHIVVAERLWQLAAQLRGMA